YKDNTIVKIWQGILSFYFLELLRAYFLKVVLSRHVIFNKFTMFLDNLSIDAPIERENKCTIAGISPIVYGSSNRAFSLVVKHPQHSINAMLLMYECYILLLITTIGSRNKNGNWDLNALILAIARFHMLKLHSYMFCIPRKDKLVWNLVIYLLLYVNNLLIVAKSAKKFLLASTTLATHFKLF
ncbi:hypothetical protein ACJX0J_019577, partial [Zea mays]